MSDSDGISRLRKAADNQASLGEATFMLPIGEVLAMLDEVEAELARLSWARGIPVPVDADGEPIRIGDVLYSRGNKCRVVGITVRADETCVGVHTDEGTFLPLVNPKYLSRKNPEPADSWEKLEEDAAKGVCDYFDHSSCLECPGFNHASHSCDKARAQDVVRRAKALAEVS